MKKITLLFLFGCLIPCSNVLAMRQWHLDESYERGIPDWLATIGAIVVIFWAGSACYVKFPKIAPFIGTCLAGYLTYRGSQQYFVNYLMVLGFGAFTLFSVTTTYHDFFTENSQDNS